MQSSPFVSSPPAPRSEMGRALRCTIGLVVLAGLAGCAHEEPPLPDQYWRDHAQLPRSSVQRTERELESIDAVVALGLAGGAHVATGSVDEARISSAR